MLRKVVTVEVNHWHRFVYLFLEDELTLEEVIRFWFIATYTGVIDDDIGKLVGINVLDNSLLYESLVLGMIRAYPADKYLTYPELADNIGKHFNTIAKAVKSLLAQGYISRRNRSRYGGIYIVEDDSHVSQWTLEFTQALVQVRTDEKLREKVYADAESRNLGFRKGIQVLKDEIWIRLFRKWGKLKTEK